MPRRSREISGFNSKFVRSNFLFDAFRENSLKPRGALAPIALENLQSRLRGMIVMTLSNHYGALVLTTGNKSELADRILHPVRRYGGAIAPIGDLYKTRVYELARYLNKAWENPDS